MFYIKNVPNWERALRVFLAFAIALLGYNKFGLSTAGMLIVASAFGFSLTGFVGWCPMCAMVGRKLKAEKREHG